VRPTSLGADGIATLLLSSLVIVLTGGLSLLWQLSVVWRLAVSAPAQTEDGDWVIVLGSRLRGDSPTCEFSARLERAYQLLRDSPQRRALLLGGRTGANRKTEAQVGSDALIARGIAPDRIQTEHTSRHTLENLIHARARLAAQRVGCLILVTSRHHLARSNALATNLGLRPLMCAAEDVYSTGLLAVARLVREAYYLHWFEVGRAWARWTGNSRSLARIT